MIHLVSLYIYYLNGEYWTRTASFQYHCHSCHRHAHCPCWQIHVLSTYKLTAFVNPFTAMLATLSLLVLKQPIKVPNLKSLKPFLPFTWAHKKILSKWWCTVFNVVPSNMLFADMCSLVSPEILQAGAVKGLNMVLPTTSKSTRPDVLHTHTLNVKCHGSLSLHYSFYR